jgi:uncharacterized protein
MRSALREERGSNVPCDGCTACCASSQFVHIGPDEADTLAHIPPELLFPAPLRPKGHVVMGYDEHGRCPMLGEHGCTIYKHRPRTCRTYDCRVFAAAGITPVAKPLIADRASQWDFGHPTAADREAHDAVRAAVTFLDAHPAVAGTSDPTALAVLAVELHDLFLGPREPDFDEVIRRRTEGGRSTQAGGRSGGTAGASDRS